MSVSDSRDNSKSQHIFKMIAKFIVILALVAVASCSDASGFSYSVADPTTGDFKNQIESRLDNNVVGQYSLLESDGTRRTVDYAAGAEGFNAAVRKDPGFIPAVPLISSPYSYINSFGYPRFSALRYGAPFPYIF